MSDCEPKAKGIRWLEPVAVKKGNGKSASRPGLTACSIMLRSVLRSHLPQPLSAWLPRIFSSFLCFPINSRNDSNRAHQFPAEHISYLHMHIVSVPETRK